MNPHSAPAPAPAPDLEPAARRMAALLGSVEDHRLTAPTPCPDYTVRELLAHVVGLTAAFRDAARKDLGPASDVPPGSVPLVLGDDWREVLPPLLDELAAAWRAPAAPDGMTRAGGVDLPAPVAAAVALNELVIHGWDLARSTGQPYRADEADLRSCEALMTPAEDRSGDGAVFGPPVPVPAGAPLLDRVIALSGRRPDWQPGD
ncbi:TIGR03086 family metal-binding protein [Streptomyces sp. NPDC079020]|uniref:TIGR03086 family metal-binding protein n=1 Tax=Streptomyces sp. NPDC079020 TaxID=3365722 RepID=UPI0037D161B2